MALAGPWLRTQHVGEKSFRRFVAVKDRVLAALLEIDDELDRDAGAARPSGIGRLAAVAGEIAGIRRRGWRGHCGFQLRFSGAGQATMAEAPPPLQVSTGRRWRSRKPTLTKPDDAAIKAQLKVRPCTRCRRRNRARSARRLRRLVELAAVSDEPGALTRLYLGPGHRNAADLVAKWMREAGMAIRIDALGNVVGRYRGRDSGPLTLDAWLAHRHRARCRPVRRRAWGHHRHRSGEGAAQIRQALSVRHRGHRVRR